MTGTIRHTLFLILFCCLASTGFAQNQVSDTTYDFIPGERIIFEDNFSRDTLGKFPSRWHITPCNDNKISDYYDKESWEVQKKDGERSLAIATSLKRIEPAMRSKYYLTDSFTIEFSFMLMHPGASAILNFSQYEQPDPCVKVNFQVCDWGSVIFTSSFPEQKITGRFPTPFDYKVWHHFALSYKKGVVNCYIDRYHTLSIPESKFKPFGFSLGCVSPVKYRNVRVASGKVKIAFSDLLAGRKIVTHAIAFDERKATIMPESMYFIRQLAEFLKTNPTIKLEIDGHANSLEDTFTNRALAVQRAIAVKNQLVSFGIDTAKLVTKGLGVSEMAETTSEHWQNKRDQRVEFSRFTGN